MSATVGLIHTVPALAGTFEQLVQAAAPGTRVVHVADPWLLRTAIATGVDRAVADRVAEHAAHLAAGGVDAVLVTCSSIGETVAGAQDRAGVPVLRVDASMATEAVNRAAAVGHEHGRPGRIAVLATLESTVGPTGRLVDEAVRRSEAAVTVVATVVEGAARAKGAGDQAGHDAAVRAAVHRAAAEADVVVLAQASMAEALDPGDGAGRDDVTVPVLTSPDGGVRAVLAVARERAGERAPGPGGGPGSR